jgi:hypothetical protein
MMPKLVEMGDPVLAGEKRSAEKEDGPLRANTPATGRSPERRKGAGSENANRAH